MAGFKCQHQHRRSQVSVQSKWTQRFSLQVIALVCCLAINSQALAERRFALVIGISNYKNACPCRKLNLAGN
jgi:hypothetical protein